MEQQLFIDIDDRWHHCKGATDYNDTDVQKNLCFNGLKCKF